MYCFWRLLWAKPSDARYGEKRNHLHLSLSLEGFYRKVSEILYRIGKLSCVGISVSNQSRRQNPLWVFHRELNTRDGLSKC